MSRELRVIAAIVAGLLALVAIARWRGAADARTAGAIAAQQDTIHALRDSVARDTRTIAALRDTVAATVAPHEEAQRAMDDEVAQSRNLARRARAAAASDSLALEEARALLIAAANRIDSLILRHAAERATASVRIGALERTVTFTVESRSTVLALANAQGRLAELALRRRPWYQRALGGVCTAGLTGSGAGAGALVGGPAGAAVGAIGGYVGGRLACP